MRAETHKKTTLSQGLEIVQLLVRTGSSLGVTQVAESLSLPKSSTHRLLKILEELGFVQQDPLNFRYSVNPRIFGFIHDFALRFGSNSKFDPLLSETAIRLQCSVYMSMLADRSTYVICAVGKDGGTTHLGSHGPAYATSSGKILVAHKPEDEWPAYAPTIHDEALTSHTDLSEDHYYQEIRQARLNGFAWNLRETAKQHASVAAAVKERLISTPRMAVALLVNYHELSIYSRETLEKEVVALAKLVSDAI